MKREKDSLEATMSRAIGAKGPDTDVWAKKAEASTAEVWADGAEVSRVKVSVDGIGTVTQKVYRTGASTNQTLIGIGSNVKHLRI